MCILGTTCGELDETLPQKQWPYNKLRRNDAQPQYYCLKNM